MPDIRRRQLFAGAALAALMLAPAVRAADGPDHPSVKRPYSLPPSADLDYTLKARQHGFSLNGDATVNWRSSDSSYSIASEARVPIFGVILNNASQGAVDAYGLAPATATEKRFRKDPTTVTFKRDSKTISFSESDQTYPIKGGEQDRTSAQWQLAAVARGAPDKFTPGSEWAFFVAGRKDADPWVFKVVNKEDVATGQGQVSALHLVKAPPPDGHKDQQVDIWLAPSLDWYPVRIRFVDDDGDFVEQTLQKVTPK